MISLGALAEIHCQSLLETCQSKCEARKKCGTKNEVCGIFGRTEVGDKGAIACQGYWKADDEPLWICLKSAAATRDDNKCSGDIKF
jgi:hypothetical protein